MAEQLAELNKVGEDILYSSSGKVAIGKVLENGTIKTLYRQTFPGTIPNADGTATIDTIPNFSKAYSIQAIVDTSDGYSEPLVFIYNGQAVDAFVKNTTGEVMVRSYFSGWNGQSVRITVDFTET